MKRNCSWGCVSCCCLYTIWQKWAGFHEHIRKISLEEETAYFTEAFCRGIGNVEAFFEKNHYDVINASTGLHKRAGVIQEK